MEPKVNPEQIERLYRFTREHFVEHYDLQTELVDHLSNAIEDQWKENPKLSFEDALQKEFKKFGVFGFMDVVGQRQIALGKKYNLLIWKHFKEYFSVPKIVGTIALVFGLFYFLKYFFFYESVLAMLIIWSLYFLFSLIHKRKKFNERTNETNKKWMFEELIFQYGSFAGLLGLPINVFNIFSDVGNSTPSDFVLFGMSLFLVALYLATYIVVKIIPSKAEHYLKQTYPEYTLID